MAENGDVNWMDRLAKNIDDMIHSKNYGKYAQNVSTPFIQAYFWTSS
jgi:hypothetical protein